MGGKGRKSKENETPLGSLLNSGDIVIPVMGPTGAGKSTFINAILEAEHRRSEATRQPNLLKVGKSLRSCTVDIEARKIQPPSDRQLYVDIIKGRSVVMVDTPGFDDTYKDDVEILQKIADWLKMSYGNKTLIAGVIYLHDISQDRFTGSVRRNLEIFKHLCGQNAFSKVVIVTTKAGKIQPEVAVQYEDELKAEYWQDIIEAGVTVRRFNQDYQSARSIVDLLLHGIAHSFILQLQKEVARDNKILPATEAGKQLRYTLKQVLESQRNILDIEYSMAKTGGTSAAEAEQRLKELKEQVKILSAQVAALRVKSSLLGRLFSGFLSRFN